MTPSRFVSSSRRLWRCISQFLVRPAINFDAVELLVCSRDDWKKSSGSEHYRVSGLLRNYQQPIVNEIKQVTAELPWRKRPLTAEPNSQITPRPYPCRRSWTRASW